MWHRGLQDILHAWGYRQQGDQPANAPQTVRLFATFPP